MGGGLDLSFAFCKKQSYLKVTLTNEAQKTETGLLENRLRLEQVPGWDIELASCSTLTFDLKLALHLSFTQVVDGLAGVHATIVGAGLPDLQSTHPLVAKHAVAWVVNDGYLVLHPDDFGLQQFVFKQCCLMCIYMCTDYLLGYLHLCILPTRGFARTLQFRVVL